MVVISIRQTACLNDVAEFRKQYIRSIGGRPEMFLEELVGYAVDVYTVSSNDEVRGYFCASPKKTLLQFFVVDDVLPRLQEIFSEMLSRGYIEKALVLTRDRVTLAGCMDFLKEVSVDSYLFEEGGHIPTVTLDITEPVFRVATLSDAPAIRAACGDFHDFLHYTLEGSITMGDIFVLLSGESVLGTGVIGSKDFEHPYVDIGMCVNEAYRKKNIGTYMITKLREECHKQGWIPGASCKSDNVASRKTLEKAGMISKDRLLRVTF